MLSDLAKRSVVHLGDIAKSVRGFIYKTWIIAELEIRKLRHDPTELITRAVQPTLWLLVFGQVFTRIRAIPTPGDVSYMDFLAPGVLAQSVLFISIFSGISLIWERDLGIIHKFLASPTPRIAIAAGRALSGGVRASLQAIIIYILAVILGVDINWSPLSLIGVFIIILLGAAGFSAFSTIMALLLKTRERFMGIGQVLTMPIFFASSAVYPIAIMPSWLKIIAKINPLTYIVDALRALMINGIESSFSLALDFGVLALFTILLITVAGRLFPRIVA